VGAYRSTWAAFSLLVSRGYAVLYPNPRGSTGRGQAFAEMVYGDMGGNDTQDLLSGIDALIERGIVDASRVGVMGGSYGGFMSSWLVTQTHRFAAAVAISPVTDWVSQHYTSNIGFFDQIFLQDDPTNAAGRYITRSPITYASRVQTPTLLTAGAVDRCTPPTQAEEFYRALIEHGVVSELVLYPGEGHGVSSFPAVIDFNTRIVGWFERFMPAQQ
jgi:dipeptidyl aminopeptidase/acylaminoacyl peptidase